MFQQINGTVANNDLFPQEFRNNVGDINNRFPSLFDGILAFIFMGVMAGSIVLALFIDTNPAFFFISLFIMVAMIIVGTILANVYDIQANSGVLAAQAQQFPITGFIMNNFVYLIVIYGFVISIVVYAKVRG